MPTKSRSCLGVTRILVIFCTFFVCGKVTSENSSHPLISTSSISFSHLVQGLTRDSTVYLPKENLTCQEAFNRSIIYEILSGWGPGSFGDYKECTANEATQKYCIGTFQSKEFDKLECSPNTNLESTNCVAGMCVPSICSNEELEDLFELLMLQKQIGNVQIVINDCAAPIKWEWHNYLCVGVIAFLLFFAAIGTIVELFVLGILPSVSPCFRDGEQTRESVDPRASKKEEGEHPKQEHGKIIVFFKAFSVYNNFKRLLAPIPGDFGFLNGLRVLCMFWIILGHSFDFLTESGLANIDFGFNHVINRWTFLLVTATPLSVDAFFFLSGFLLGFFLLQELYKKGTFNIFLFYFHRVWRIWPLYLFLMFVYTNLAPVIANGPHWMTFQNEIHQGNPYCWTNLLFINNFYPLYQNMCMRWSWFLADDMQFYIISPIFVFTYYKSKTGGWLLLWLSFISCLIINAILFNKCIYEGNCGVAVTYLGNNAFFNEIYIKPYTRIAPYFIGIGTAFLLHAMKVENATTKNKYMKLDIAVVTLGFALAGFLILSTIYGTYNSSQWEQTGLRSTSYLIFSRSAFTFGVAITCLLFSLGYGGIIKRVFSLAVWDPFAKLTYGAYLLHPVVIRVFYFSQPSPLPYSDINIYYWFIGTTFTAYTCAAISYCLTEKPFMNLEMLFLPKHK